MEIEVKNNQDKKQNNLDKLEIIEKKRQTSDNLEINVKETNDKFEITERRN